MVLKYVGAWQVEKGVLFQVVGEEYVMDNTTDD